MKRGTFRRGGLAAGGLLALIAVALAPSAEADSAVVAKVGERKILAADVASLADYVGPYRLRSLGKTPDDVRQRLLDEFVSAELLALSARAENMHERPDVRDRIQSVLASALMADLRREAIAGGDVSDDEVRAYFEENAERYAAEERIRIWQISVPTKELAEKILATIRDDPEYQKAPVEGWDKLTREHTIDETTKNRKGDLGFVLPDGRTAHENIRVPPNMVEAAQDIEDGEVFPRPIQVDEHWVVLQRRGSHVVPPRTLATEANSIRGLLSKQKVSARLGTLLEQLRSKNVHDKQPNNVDLLAIDFATKEVAAAPRPGTMRNPHAARPTPQGAPGELR